MSSKWVKDYLIFSKKERLAIVVLILLILSVYFLPSLLSYPKRSAIDVARFDSLAAMFNERDSDEVTIKHKSDYASERKKNTEVFFFDPNKASYEDWSRLGINDKTIRIIQHYIEKGGKFKRVEDLKRIYGFKEDDYQKLKPYIRIGGKEANHFLKIDSSTEKGDDNTYQERSKKEFFTVDLNLADTATLSRLPGIGSKLASRIIHFRDKLGGFYSTGQLAETYGLADSTYEHIKPFLTLGSNAVVKININEADISRLQQHPYIGWSMAKAVVQYRDQHGPFSNVEDILKISTISNEQLKKLIPYLSTY